MSAFKEHILDPMVSKLTRAKEWYTLDYVIPQKPDYLSKNQNSPVYYSRYYIEKFVVSPQKEAAAWNFVFGAIALITAIPTGGSSMYLYAIVSGAWGISQMVVSSMKLEDLENENYFKDPKFLGMNQHMLDVTGIAFSVVDLAFLIRGAGRVARNFINESTRTKMLTGINDPAVRRILDNAGRRMGGIKDSLPKTWDEFRNSLNLGFSGKLALETGGKTLGKNGGEPWYLFSEGKGTKNTGKGNSTKPKPGPETKPQPGAEGTGNVPEGYYQDASGRWHRPDGGYASNKEVGLPEPSSLSKRLEYMGDTPGKNSRTGKEVIERMKNEVPPKIRTTRSGEMEFMVIDKNGKEVWYPIEEADMAHVTDAVSWWNSTGRYYGAKSPEVREWMLDSKNYVLDHFSSNRSAGAKLKETYLPPIK